MTAPLARLAEEVRADLAAKRWCRVDGPRLWKALCSAGAKASNLPALDAQWAQAVPQRNAPSTSDSGVAPVYAQLPEVYPFKSTLISHYELQPGATCFRRMDAYDWLPDRAYSLERIDDTTVQGKDVAFLRLHRQWLPEVDANCVVASLHRLLALVMAGDATGQKLFSETAPGTDASSEDFHMQMAAYRVVHLPVRAGEPGPEGVHQDVASLTVILLWRRENLTEESAGNRIWALEQPSGKPDQSREHLLFEGVLREKFDTLFVLDRRVKHEALPIRPQRSEQPAVRDVLTFEIRRPWLLGPGARTTVAAKL